MVSLKDFKKRLPKEFKVKEWKLIRSNHPAWYCGVPAIVVVANKDREVKLVPTGDFRVYFGMSKFEYIDGIKRGELTSDLLREGVIDAYNWIEVRELVGGKESCVKVAYTIDDAIERMLAIL